MRHLSAVALGLAVLLSYGCSCGTPPIVPDAGCEAGKSCATNPGADCFAGVTACDPFRCVNGAMRAPGTSCGTGQFCDSTGACVACEAGAACNAGTCKVGMTSCAGGASMCTATGNSAAGTACGSNAVCDGMGSCVTCSAGMACLTNPGGPCRQGGLICSSGTPVCVDLGPAAPGGACGTDHVCDGDGGCISCMAGVACPTGGDECVFGLNTCAAGRPVCVISRLPDGVPCDAGVCGAGTCQAARVIDSRVNLTVDPVFAGRTCAAGVAYPVRSLSAQGVELAEVPDAGCLDPGDEVMIINLQGVPGAVANVGAWETLIAAQFNGASVVFSSPITRAYGEAPGSNAGILDGGQKVMLLRIPAFGSVIVADGGVLTANTWNGTLGGVVALRAVQLDVQGQISAFQLGYQSGLWSQDDSSCTDNVQTAAGESIAGKGAQAPDASYGGSGGLGPLSGLSFTSNGPTGATAGHAQAGLPGGNLGGRTAPEPGHAYGLPDGGTLTLGSGGGGSLTCASGVSGPALADFAAFAGGIIWVHADTLHVLPGGLITAAGWGYDNRWASTGGSVMLRGNTLVLSDGGVSALGGVEDALMSTPATAASPGYVTVFYKTSVTGNSTPPAFTAQAPGP